jgi:hypothetical protein
MRLPFWHISDYITPVMYIDPSGNFAFFITMAIIGFVVGGGIGLGIGLSKDHTGWNLAKDILIGAFIGSATGALIGAVTSGALTGGFLANWTAVKAGANLVYGMYKAAGVTAAGYMMLGNLQNSFYSLTHVFWSGGEYAKDQATEFANSIGGKTLGMTSVGQYLQTLEYNRNAWIIASQNFAGQVSSGSSVYAIIYYPGMAYDSIWFIESKILVDKAVEIVRGALQ